MGIVNDQLEQAILTVLRSYPDGEHQDYWAAWHTAVTKRVPDLAFTNDDLRWAFENLASYGDVVLTKPDSTRKHAIEYSPAISQGLANIDSRTFFLNGPFNATIKKQP